MKTLFYLIKHKTGSNVVPPGEQAIDKYRFVCYCKKQVGENEW